MIHIFLIFMQKQQKKLYTQTYKQHILEDYNQAKINFITPYLFHKTQYDLIRMKAVKSYDQ